MDDTPQEVTEALGLIIPRADVVQQIYERAAEMASLDHEIFLKEQRTFKATQNKSVKRFQQNAARLEHSNVRNKSKGKKGN